MASAVITGSTVCGVAFSSGTGVAVGIGVFVGTDVQAGSGVAVAVEGGVADSAVTSARSTGGPPDIVTVFV